MQVNGTSGGGGGGLNVMYRVLGLGLSVYSLVAALQVIW